MNNNIIIVIPNDSLRSTVSSHIAKYVSKDSIFECDNEKEALWQAMKHVPDTIITSYHERQVNSYELILRLRKINPKLAGYILYDPESDEYEDNLITNISNSNLLTGISALKLSDFIERLEIEFSAK